MLPLVGSIPRITDTIPPASGRGWAGEVFDLRCSRSACFTYSSVSQPRQRSGKGLDWEHGGQFTEPPVTAWQLVYIPAEPMTDRSRAAIVTVTWNGRASLAGKLHMVSIIPGVPLKRADDLVGRIEALVADAQAEGQKSIAYFLNMALIEARIQLRPGEDDSGVGVDDRPRLPKR